MSEDDYVIDEPDVPPAPKPDKKPAKQKASAEPPSKPEHAASKPGKKMNKRLGRIKKTNPDEPAEFEPGGASGSKSFDPAEYCEKARLWWENDGGDSFILQIDEELWSRWPKASVEKELREMFKGAVWHARRESEQLSEMDRLMLYARKHRCVHRLVNALAGYRSGVHEGAGGRFIVGTSPKIVKPEERDWSMMREFIEGRLKPKSPGGWQCQATMFHAWCKTSYESLATGEPGSYMGGHLLVLAGPGDSGKSRLQTNVITPLLGGRSADPTPFLMGDDTFNADMIESESLVMEELSTGSQKTHDRVQLSESFKKLVATEKKRVRLMKRDPFTVEPFWRPSLSVNNDPDKMRAFPMLTPDFRDKVLMLLVDAVPLPMPTDTPMQRKEWNERMKVELPGYIWWLLNEFKLPEELLVDEYGKRATRFGFRAWQHPELSSELFDDTPAAQLLRLIDAAELKHEINGTLKLWELLGPHNNLAGKKGKELGSWEPYPGLWTGSAVDLEKWLTSAMTGWKSSVEKEAEKLFRHVAVDRLLGRLKEDRFDRVAQERRNHARLWSIEAAPTGE